MTEHHGRIGIEGKWVYVWKEVRIEIIRRDLSHHSKEGKRLRRIARIAKACEEATRAAHQASNAFPLYKEAVAAGEAYIEEAEALLEFEPLAMQGILVVARTISFLPRALVAAGYQPVGALAGQLGGKLAGALDRIGGDDAA